MRLLPKFFLESQDKPQRTISVLLFPTPKRQLPAPGPAIANNCKAVSSECARPENHFHFYKTKLVYCSTWIPRESLKGKKSTNSLSWELNTPVHGIWYTIIFWTDPFSLNQELSFESDFSSQVFLIMSRAKRVGDLTPQIVYIALQFWGCLLRSSEVFLLRSMRALTTESVARRSSDHHPKDEPHL